MLLFTGIVFFGDREYKKNQILNIKDTYKIEIDDGEVSGDVLNKLVKDKVVDSELMTKAFLKLNSELSNNIMSGSYVFKKGTSLEKMWTDFSKGNQSDLASFQVIEGETLSEYAKQLATALGDKDRWKEIIEFWNSKEFINTIIEKNDCIDDSILNDQIYFPLEGYFSPNTYLFNKSKFNFDNLDYISNYIISQRDVDYNKIIKSDQDYNQNIKNFHELLTLASIVEREALSLEDKKIVAGIFINRLNNNDRLGSDITTYYAEQVPIHERDLTQEELDKKNSYNTRGDLLGLPVGPVNNPSVDSINAALNYKKNDYYYFVSDKNGNMYYSKTAAEHQQIIKKLKKDGLWYVW